MPGTDTLPTQAPPADDFSQRLSSMLNGDDLSAAPAEEASQEQSTSADERETYTAQPVGHGDHVVRDGECVSSIAKDSGHFWETIWSDSQNEDLKTARQEPNVLLPGDRVFVPPIRPKCEPGQSEMRHRFVRRGEPGKIRMVLRRNGEPRANEPYTLEIDGVEFSGTLDAEGKLERVIPGDAKQGKLIVGEGADAKEYTLKLGGLDPVESLSGLQARLTNLGFAAGKVTGEMNEQTQSAIRKFQARHELPETGEADEATRTKVREIHGF